MNEELISCTIGILTYNSGKYLARCLNSLQGFGEIIISDGGSTDNTLEIAKKYNCKIIEQTKKNQPIDDFSRERNNIFDQAKYDWFFYLDSDEIMSPELRLKMSEEVMKKENKFQLFKIKYSLVGERLQVFQSYKPYYQIRLFNRNTGARFIKKMHEKVIFDETKYQVGVINEPWFVPLDINLDFKVYRSKVEFRIRQMLSSWKFCVFSKFLTNGIIPEFFSIIKQIYKIIYLRLKYESSEIVPLKYEFYRIYSHLFTIKELIRQFFILRKKIDFLNMRKMYLIFHGRFPSEKAAALFVAKSCEAFADLSLDVTILVPKMKGWGSVDPFSFYQIKNNFKIDYLPTIDLFSNKFFKHWAFLISFIIFSISCFFYLLFKNKKDVIVYSNESLPLLLISFLTDNTFYEVHDFPERKFKFYNLLFKRLRWILSTNRWKKNRLSELFKIKQDKILYEPNAIDLNELDLPVNRVMARQYLSLPLDKKIVVYTGHLYYWKGVDTLADAAKLLPDDYLVYFVGGTDADIVNFKNKYGKINGVILAGYRAHMEIPYWQKSADVLILPNTAKEKISYYYTSPMKMFEYMASGTPIVATNIQSTTEILNNDNSLLVEPDSPIKLAEVIQQAVRDTDLAKKISKKAYLDVQKHTWNKRAQRIYQFITL